MPFNVKVISGSPSLPAGQYRAEVNADGLQLARRRETVLDIPVGTPAKYREKNRLALKLEDGPVELKVSKLGSYHNRLAKDVAAFLNRQCKTPVLSRYTLPWYFWVISALPLGIPVMLLGGAIPGAIGGGFAAGCFAVCQNEDWPDWVRALIALALVALAYVVAFSVAVGLVFLQAGR